MQDHADIPLAPPYGLRPETWAVAEYDALREALNALLAETMAEIDYCEKWLDDHEAVVGAGGTRQPLLAAWVQRLLGDLEKFDDKLLQLRDCAATTQEIRAELDQLKTKIFEVTTNQWPLGLDFNKTVVQQSEKATPPERSGMGRGDENA